MPESLFFTLQGQHQSSDKASCRGPVGVGKTISETDQGIAGTWESLTPPRERMRTDGQPRDQMTGLHRKLAAPEVTERKAASVKWYPYRGRPKGRRRAKAVLASS